MVLEEWKVIPDFSRYKVSNQGRVWNITTNKEAIQVLTGVPQYKYVNMVRDDGKWKLLRVHKLIAEAFVPNPENLEMVDHINQDKMDNRISNLRWVSRSKNQRNMSNSVYVGEMLLIEKIEKDFEQEWVFRAYKSVHQAINSGYSYEEGVERYRKYLKRQYIKHKP